MSRRLNAWLEDYTASKYTPKRRVRYNDDIPIADVLSIYLDAQLEKLRDRFKVDSENEGSVAAIRKFKKRIERLNGWGAKMLGEVNGEACRAYREKRRNRGGARRDLENFRAAVGRHTAEGYHREIVEVLLPEEGEPLNFDEGWLPPPGHERLTLARHPCDIQPAYN